MTSEMGATKNQSAALHGDQRGYLARYITVKVLSRWNGKSENELYMVFVRGGTATARSKDGAGESTLVRDCAPVCMVDGGWKHLGLACYACLRILSSQIS